MLPDYFLILGKNSCKDFDCPATYQWPTAVTLDSGPADEATSTNSACGNKSC